MPLERIVSGGQTGVDRGALDAALAANFPAGGWCPAGRAAEDGVIAARYPLKVLEGAGYRARTRQNVIDSDATLIIAPGELTGGTHLTRSFCTQHGKAHLIIDATRHTPAAAAIAIAAWLDRNRIAVLNVAGPRASGWPEGHAYAEQTLGELLWQL